MMRMQDDINGIATFKQDFSSFCCNILYDCEVDGAFTPSSLICWLMDNLEMDSEAGEF